ncbi:MAG: cardiolipin synthase, partial [Thermoplasmata archaeon]|nr:cardiolipin synthase [Thermoplasmata archaeon]
LIPSLVGVPLYILFHQNHRRKRRRFDRKAKADLGILDRHGSASDEHAKGGDLPVEWEGPEEYRELARLVSRADPHAPVSTNNDVRLFVDGREKFDAFLRDLRDAQDHAHVEYYIMRNDELAIEILEVLEDRARNGVEVRLLLDALGGRSVKRRTRALTDAGAHVAFFYPGFTRTNYRNHRKIAVVDGRIGYCGGYNIGDEYLGKGPLGYWRDAAVRVEGPGVDQLQIRFLRDWMYGSGELVRHPSEYLRGEATKSSAMVQQVSNGPDTRRQSIKEAYVKMIMMARESCYLQTPYFLPDTSVLDALRVAAASGVDVRIMIPDKPDHPFVFWASQSFCADLLADGVRSYRYSNGFIHAKTMVVDGKVGSVGSANIGMRSFRLNFETNVVVYDETVAGAMRAAFLDDLAVSSELTPEEYAKRGFVVRFKEPFSRLFFPLV